MNTHTRWNMVTTDFYIFVCNSAGGESDGVDPVVRYTQRWTNITLCNVKNL